MLLCPVTSWFAALYTRLFITTVGSITSTLKANIKGKYTSPAVVAVSFAQVESLSKIRLLVFSNCKIPVSYPIKFFERGVRFKLIPFSSVAVLLKKL